VLVGKRLFGNFKHRQVKVYFKERECAYINGGLGTRPVLDSHEKGNGHKLCVVQDTNILVCYIVVISKQLLIFQMNIEAVICK
jgi:hypothetical protein